MKIFNGSQVKKSLVLTFVWLAIFWLLGARPFWSFRSDLHDHISNLHATLLFWDKGSKIYEHPVSDLVANDKSATAEKIAEQWKWPKEELFVLPTRSNNSPLMLVWPHMPRPYPPGLYLTLSPLAALMELTGGFSEFILVLMTMTFCFIGHLAFFQLKSLFDGIYQKSLPRILYWFILSSLYFEFVGWSISGQYEAFGLFFLTSCLGALAEKKYLDTLVYFCIGAFIHFRVIFWCIPLTVVWLGNVRHIFSKFIELPRFKKIVPLLAIAGGLTSGLVFLKVTKSLLTATQGANQFSLKLLNLDFTASHFTFVIGIFVCCTYFIWKKNWLMILAVVNILLLFMNANFLQPWYVIFLLPLLVAFNSSPPTKTEVMVRYGLIMVIGSSFLNSSPSEFYFLKRLIIMMGLS